jgi:hypothetical protein
MNGRERRSFSVASTILGGVANLQLSFVLPAYGQGSGATIKICALFATSGPGAYQGVQQKEGAELAVEQLNKSGVNGWKFQLYHEDSACAPLPATQAAKRLIETVWPVYERLEALQLPIYQQPVDVVNSHQSLPPEDRSSILISNAARWLRLTMAGDGSDSTVAGAGN